MTLRTAVCIYHRGRLAVAERSTGTGTPHDDDGGIGVLKFLWQPGNIERLRKGLQHVATLTPEGRKEVRAFSGGGMDLLETIAQATAEKPVPIWLNVDFAISVWCDWAYLVNLDQNTFEVYVLGERGYLPKDSSTQLSRFAGVDEPGATGATGTAGATGVTGAVMTRTLLWAGHDRPGVINRRKRHGHGGRCAEYPR